LIERSISQIQTRGPEAPSEVGSVATARAAREAIPEATLANANLTSVRATIKPPP
jgi:hypothetical protein